MGNTINGINSKIKQYKSEPGAIEADIMGMIGVDGFIESAGYNLLRIAHAYGTNAINKVLAPVGLSEMHLYDFVAGLGDVSANTIFNYKSPFQQDSFKGSKLASSQGV